MVQDGPPERSDRSAWFDPEYRGDNGFGLEPPAGSPFGGDADLVDGNGHLVDGNGHHDYDAPSNGSTGPYRNGYHGYDDEWAHGRTAYDSGYGDRVDGFADGRADGYGDRVDGFADGRADGYGDRVDGFAGREPDGYADQGWPDRYSSGFVDDGYGTPGTGGDIFSEPTAGLPAIDDRAVPRQRGRHDIEEPAERYDPFAPAANGRGGLGADSRQEDPFDEDDDRRAYGVGRDADDRRAPLDRSYDDYFDDDEEDDLADVAATSTATRNALEWAVVLVGAILVALVLRASLFQAFYIPSESMESTLHVNDRVLVNKLSYRLHEIHRGDVIVFTRPDGEDADGIRDLIKRVIGVPGDRVQARDNQVFINNQLLIEPYLDEGTITRDFGPIIVPEGEVFVMGDNRGDSRDSRSFGTISEDRVIGRAFFLFWPLNRIGSL